jgi:ATP-binding cassette subfamily B protein IrtA
VDRVGGHRPDASHDDVVGAATAAYIHDRIMALPNGYDSVVGDDAHFSGGEAQRVSVARALLADTPILVLDEATAFADPDSEAQIQAALSRLIVGRTVLVIAHRLGSIVGADNIVVLDEGCITEQGRHEELLDRGGQYARMWASYTAGQAKEWEVTK